MQLFLLRACWIAATLGLLACGGESSSSDPTDDGDPREDLVGEWVREHAAGKYVYTFAVGDDAALFTHASYSAGKDTPNSLSEGQFSALAHVLAIWTSCELSKGQPGSQETGPYALYGDEFSRDQVYLRASLGDGILGTWEMKWTRHIDEDCTGFPEEPHKTRIDTLLFREDGSFEYTSEQNTTLPSGAVVPIVDPIAREGTWTQETRGDVDVLYTQDDHQTAVYVYTGDLLFDTNPSWMYSRRVD